MKGYRIIVTPSTFKPRSKARIFKTLCNDHEIVKEFSAIDNPTRNFVLKQIAAIAHEFDCVIRDTARELVDIKKENEVLVALLQSIGKKLPPKKINRKKK